MVVSLATLAYLLFLWLAHRQLFRGEEAPQIAREPSFPANKGASLVAVKGNKALQRLGKALKNLPPRDRRQEEVSNDEPKIPFTLSEQEKKVWAT